MSSEGGSERASMGGSVDWKTLFLGACTVIVLLSGATFRVWDSANQRSSHQFNEDTQELKRKVASLEATAIEQRFQITQLQHEHREFKAGNESQNRAIYSLEQHYLPMDKRR